jgi:hypothetical protein
MAASIGSAQLTVESFRLQLSTYRHFSNLSLHAFELQSVKSTSRDSHGSGWLLKNSRLICSVVMMFLVQRCQRSLLLLLLLLVLLQCPLTVSVACCKQCICQAATPMGGPDNGLLGLLLLPAAAWLNHGLALNSKKRLNKTCKDSSTFPYTGTSSIAHTNLL